MLPKDVFARRRARFYEGLKEGIALVFSSPEVPFGHDVHHRYRPDPDLFYLTGFPEPEAVGLFDADHRRLTLFVREKDRAREAWDGRRAGPKGARADHGADAAYPIGELHARAAEAIRKASTLHYAIGSSAEGDHLVIDSLVRFRREARNPQRGPVLLADPTDVLHDLRLVKEPEEIALMERSAAIAARAHKESMVAARPGRFEYEAQAVIERRFLAGGATGPAYGTIVASGPNATVLHYRDNTRRIEAGDLVLIDAGCEYHGYASDVTRTFPASGRFTKAQRRFYEVVLKAQEAAIRTVRPGVRFDDVHETARDILVDGLIDLGLLKGRSATLKRGEKDSRFRLHKTSHWLGMDVHDRGRYVEADGTSRVLRPGMVLTVEPGLYVRMDEKNVPKELLGLGVRIEDDVLVTGDGQRVLTAAAEKSVAAMER